MLKEVYTQKNKNKGMYSKEQLDAFQETASHYSNEEELYVGLKAIRLVDGQRFVIQYEGLAGTKDPVTGIEFNNDFPFGLYQSLVGELQKRDKRRKYAEKMTVAHLEDTALTLSAEEF